VDDSLFILQTCPHRYSRQEPCSVISVDVKNHSNLQDSLAEYTKVGTTMIPKYDRIMLENGEKKKREKDTQFLF
jgi:hypothetical protein